MGRKKKESRYYNVQLYFLIMLILNSRPFSAMHLNGMIKKEHEVTKIYRLLTNKPHTEERIVIGMGEFGKMTRILGPMLGSYLTYASTPYGESAPGQIDINELKEIYKLLENNKFTKSS